MAGYYARRITVNCNNPKCRVMFIDEKAVEVLDIEEDIERRDILTFKCPHCGETARSLRRG